jgi:hypothetical protein
MPTFPKLVGRDSAGAPKPEFQFATTNKTKTIGNYWPHATTVFDYIKRAAASAVGAVSSAASAVASAISAATSITDFSTKTKANLDRFGDYPVVAIQVRRVPIAATLDLALQGVSGGRWEDLKAKYGFDKLFHLSMVVTLQGSLKTGRKPGEGGPNGAGPSAPRGFLRTPKKLAIEKLAVVSVNENIDVGPGMETIEIAVPQPFTILELFSKTRARIGDPLFFSYSAFSNNWQNFVRMLLETVGLYTEPVAQFVYQDISSIAAELPDSTLAITQGVTDLGALANKYLGIGGRLGCSSSIPTVPQRGTGRKRGVLKELMAGAGPPSVEQLADRFAEYLGDRQPTEKLFDDWVAECKIQLA